MLKNHISFDKCARWIALAFRFLWFMAFLLIPAPRVVRPQELRQPMKPMNSVPASRQTIYAPLAALDDPSAAEIVVLNNGVSLTPVEATLYGADGRILNTSRLNLPPGEPRYIPISNLVPGLNQPQAHLGGINLSYVGQSMQVVAQITIQGNAKRGSFEV